MLSSDQFRKVNFRIKYMGPIEPLDYLFQTLKQFLSLIMLQMKQYLRKNFIRSQSDLSQGTC